ncbi:hypothetical protein [Bacillus salipaludis]|uniref:LXG domain-containing protein n=1 Tax=Bacillus salipaludis TaxID=2547811 RepID=A0ABW8RHL0_9BACI
MSQINIKVSDIKVTNKNIKSISSNLTETRNRLSTLRSEIDSDISRRRNISSNLNNTVLSLNKLEKQLVILHHFIDDSMDRYVKADKKADAITLSAPEKKSFWDHIVDGFEVIGDVVKGFGTGVADAVIATLEGLWNVITHPIETVKGIVHVVQHPIETAKSIWESIKNSWNNDVVNGDSESRGNWFGRAFGEVALAVVGTKGVDKAVKLTKGVKVVEEAGGVRVGEKIVNQKTSDSIRKVVNENGYDADYFIQLLNPGKVLNEPEKNAVKLIRDQIGIPMSGTLMAKVIPQSDIYKYLYNDYKGVRGFTAVEEHSANLKTLKENYEGARLDYNNSAFKLTNGVDGISQSVGAPDKFYGVIEYRINDPKQLSIPTWDPTPDNYPFTGRGFTGSSEIILPEYYQAAKDFGDGDLLKIIDAKNGDVTTQFIFDADLKSWIPLK